MAYAAWFLFTCIPVSFFLGLEIIARVMCFGLLSLIGQAGRCG